MRKSAASSASEPLRAETLLRSGVLLEPDSEAKKRIQNRIQQRIAEPQLFREVRTALTPAPSTAQFLWNRIVPQIRSAVTPAFWRQLLKGFQPDLEAQNRVFQRISSRIRPERRPVFYRPLSWVAAFAVIALVVQASPVLFFAPTSAQSHVTLLGESLSVLGSGEGLWLPLSQTETTLSRSALVRSGDHPGTIVMHDDMVVRMEPNTTIAVHDLSDSPESETYDRTLTLQDGSAWFQGWVPAALPGKTILATNTLVTLNEGSVQIFADGTVKAWDQHVTVTHNGTTVTLVAGEEYRSIHDKWVVRNIPEQEFENEDVKQNLARDAVHSREIAQIQFERRVSRAGVLPTNPILYAVKRTVENVDTALTFDEQSRTRKILDQANTRLDEATALLQEGNPQAQDALDAYRQAVLSVATGSSLATQSIVQHELAAATADVAATLPGDKGYLVKATVIETAAALPGASTKAEDTLLADKVQAATHQVEEGKIADAKKDLQALLPQLNASDSSQELKEAAASLSIATVAFNDSPVPTDLTAAASSVSSSSAAAELHRPDREPTPPAVATEDKIELVGDSIGLLHKYDADSRTLICSQSVSILRTISGHPDEEFIIGRILRDAKAPYSDIFRDVLMQTKAGERINCNPKQPQETVF